MFGSPILQGLGGNLITQGFTIDANPTAPIILQGLTGNAIVIQGYSFPPVVPVIPAPKRVQDVNLVGTYAIVPELGKHTLAPEFGRQKEGFRYIAIEFTYGETKYHDAFYNEQEIDVVLENMHSQPAKRQQVLLERFRGTIAWKR